MQWILEPDAEVAAPNRTCRSDRLVSLRQLGRVISQGSRFCFQEREKQRIFMLNAVSRNPHVMLDVAPIL